jgi:transglutaminase-like putative cysteine protease
MKLRITHRTAFRYPKPVSEGLNELRLHPVSNETQKCLSFDVRIFPEAKLSHYLDFFLNRVHFFEMPEPHSELSVESVSTVETFPAQPRATMRKATWDEFPALARTDICYDFLQSSQFVSTNVQAWRLARDVTAGIDDVWVAAESIMRHVHDSFIYDPLATNVRTPMEEALTLRRGVCQDFAHVMLGLCRCMKIPARYVSGYIFYEGGEHGLVGSDATHAWCEVYLPETGWIGLDPTNNQIVSDQYVKVAVGRDYADITPVRGAYRGSSVQEMEVQVSVVEVK